MHEAAWNITRPGEEIGQALKREVAPRGVGGAGAGFRVPRYPTQTEKVLEMEVSPTVKQSGQAVKCG